MREATRVDIGWKLFSTILQIGKPLRTIKKLSQFVVDFQSDLVSISLRDQFKFPRRSKIKIEIVTRTKEPSSVNLHTTRFSLSTGVFFFFDNSTAHKGSKPEENIFSSVLSFQHPTPSRYWLIFIVDDLQRDNRGPVNRHGRRSLLLAAGDVSSRPQNDPNSEE